MTSIAKNELHFNLACHEMAKSNLLLAYKYAIDLSPNFLSRYLPKPASASFTLKDRCINLIKAPLLSLRAILLCVPIVNRVTQLALRFLSPRKLDEFIKSSPVHFRPKKKELEIRYSENIRLESIKEQFKDKIKQKQKFNLSDLDLFKNWGFSSKELRTIFTKLSPPLSIDLIKSSEFKKDEVKARYSKNTRREFIENYFKDKIDNKQEFNPSDLDSFKDWGFSSKELRTIFTKLSPPLSIELINSPEFKKDEVKVRYSEDTCYKFMKDCFKHKINRKIENKLQLIEKDIQLSDAELAAVLKLGFTIENYFDIALPLLEKNWKAICSRDLQEKISTYQKKHSLN